MALTAVTGFVRRAKFLVNENSTTILTAMGITGTVTTAYLTGRASFRAAQIIAQKEREDYEHFLSEVKNVENGNSESRQGLTLVKKVRLVWRLYLVPIGVGVTTVTSIIVANKISSKKIAALAVASGISDRALQEYKAKVVEKLGERQNRAIRDEVAQDRVNKNPASREIILAGTGEVLCYDLATGRYFQSTVEEIKRAENKVNHALVNYMHASASEFYDEIGLPATTYTDSVGWNQNHHVSVVFSTVMSLDDRPCIAIDFDHPPFADYARLHDN